MAICSILFAGCSSPGLVETDPEQIYDTSTVTITCNARQGNKGLLGYTGPVFVHAGVITDSSLHATDWRYVKFTWGSTQQEAQAKPEGANRWSYTIPNVRNFFGVPENEKLLNIAILFRAGNCIDTACKTLRNEDKSDILIPVH